MMKVYLIIDINIKDREIYREYTRKAEKIIEEHGGRYIVRCSDPAAFSGNWTPERIVVIEFPSREDLDRCFASEEYSRIAPLREGATEGKAVIAYDSE
jgi:uncharacterized protein (DUF1330 family)